MERLTDIRSKTKTWNKHLNRMVAGWSFYQLQNFVEYKAAAFGISVEYVNPAYSSQTCHQCFNLGSRKGERFNCLTCGEQHADVNASHVIALGGAACKPARIRSR
jgi:transposase